MFSTLNINTFQKNSKILCIGRESSKNIETKTNIVTFPDNHASYFKDYSTDIGSLNP